MSALRVQFQPNPIHNSIIEELPVLCAETGREGDEREDNLFVWGLFFCV
jgi:hypothetical protein